MSTRPEHYHFPRARGRPFEHAAETALGRQIEQALAELGEGQREVLLLVGVEGMEQERAAAVLGLTPAALRQRLSRARAQVQEFLNKASSDNESLAGTLKIGHPGGPYQSHLSLYG